MDDSSQQGLVLRVDAKVCHVEIDGERLVLPLRGRLFERRGDSRQPIAVGDRVMLRRDEQGGAIEAVLPRTTVLHRRASTEGEARMQVLAANISLVVAVASAQEPPFQPELVDGILAAAEREGIRAVLVITKIDRAADGAAPWIELYRRIGYTVLPTCTVAGRESTASLAEFRDLLHHNESVLCGLSGVGKSTLLNAVVPGLDLHIGSLNHIQQGRHTTTHTELIPLPGGGHVLDTPGVRSFHLFHSGSQELSFHFPEIRAVRDRCQFSGCLHQQEPRCAVRQAVEQGDIAASRYASYRVMLAAAVAAEVPAAKRPAGGGPGRRRPRPR